MATSVDGSCNLTTQGGSILGIVGESFGNSGARVYFDGVELAFKQLLVTSHTVITFSLPPGTGTSIPVTVRVGTKLSNTVYFDYDMPRITQISPAIFDAEGDVLEVSQSGMCCMCNSPCVVYQHCALR